ncbi:hypothetical protein Sbal183_2335 [Shewanella baltica OS183]|nr:hypothetical protein Sbal175_1969 [Shewanella baltica BA175]EHQ15232.1 hypothetical protein Sbal183_2335 [Shewanella baltica OS183]
MSTITVAAMPILTITFAVRLAKMLLPQNAFEVDIYSDDDTYISPQKYNITSNRRTRLILLLHSEGDSVS